MAHNTVWSTLFLGNRADLETDESSQGMDDPSVLLTTFGDGAGKALSHNIVDIHTSSRHDNVIDTDNWGTSDTMQYDLGGGTVTVQLDSVVLLHGTVTFHDRSTFDSNLGVIQDDSGNVFMLALDNQPQLGSQAIDSVSFDKVVHNYYGGVYQGTKDDVDFVCFGPGTRIETPLGPRRVDRLCVGDQVMTLDDGPQPIRWIGKRRLRFDTPGRARPVQIAKGAFGHELPRRDLLLSPDHRVLVDTASSHVLHDPLGALAPVKALTRQPGVRIAQGRRAITYYSLLLPMHAVIIAEGIAAESLYPGPQSWRALSGPERSAWMRLAPAGRVTGAAPARLLLSTAEARAGLDAGAFFLRPSAPQPLSWTACHRRSRPLPAHIASI